MEMSYLIESVLGCLSGGSLRMAVGDHGGFIIVDLGETENKIDVISSVKVL